MVIPLALTAPDGPRHPLIATGCLLWLLFSFTMVWVMSLRRLFPEVGLGCMAAFKGWCFVLGLFALLGAIDAATGTANVTSPLLLVAFWLAQFYPAVSLVEGLGLFQGVSRSFRLLSGHHVQALAAYFCLWVLAFVATAVIVTVGFVVLNPFLERTQPFAYAFYLPVLFVLAYQIECLALNLAINLTLYQELRSRQAQVPAWK